MKTTMPFFAILILCISAVAGAAVQESPVVAPIRTFIDSFNKGDMKAAAAVMSPSGVVIIDDVAPHVWAGPDAFDAWSKALDASDKDAGYTGAAVEAGKPTRVIADAERGYVVMPTVYTFKKNGVAMRETAQLICALQKGPGGWLITSWTWAGTKPKTVDASDQLLPKTAKVKR